MPHTSSEYRIYKPCRSASIAYMWDAVTIMTGVLGLAFFHQSTLAIIFGLAMCLLGLWQFLRSRNVLRTHFLATKEEIATVGPRYALALRWEEISEVMIRERPKGMQPGRADRLVVLIGPGGRQMPLNISVLSQEDENHLLSEIQSQVHCPIQKITDGCSPLLRRRPQNS